jgi:peptide/nickel transport system ATP-binding protein
VNAEPICEVKDLRVTFTGKHRRDVVAVDGVSLSVLPAQTVAVVGESGSGKSVTALAAMRLLPRRGVQISGSVLFEGVDLLTLDEQGMRDRRGRDLAMVFQDPMSSLNPVITVGLQITEVLVRHRGLSAGEAKIAAAALLRRVGIPDPARRLGEYPHQLSGGMRQRVLIATALACEPRLLICDEPTTALDVTIQAQILELLRELVAEAGTSLIMITHDLGIVAGLCDTVNVMYAGRIVESATRRELFARPRHRYTTGLLASVPRLDQPRGEPLRPIPGSVGDTIAWARGCAFSPRCTFATEACLDPSLALSTDPFAGADAASVGHLVRCVHPRPSDETSGERAPVTA